MMSNGISTLLKYPSYNAVSISHYFSESQKTALKKECLYSGFSTFAKLGVLKSKKEHSSLLDDFTLKSISKYLNHQYEMKE